MKTCWEPGAPVQLSRSDNPRRKLAWTLERVGMGAGWVGVNTHRVNAVVAEAAAAGRLPGFEALRDVRREIRPPLDDGEGSRLDLLLEGAGQAPVFVEIKNTTLLEGALVRFPDAVSLRAAKHLRVLHRLVASGRRGVILFAINRPEGDVFAPADDIDPDYGRVLREVVDQGVAAIAIRLEHGPSDMATGSLVPIAL